jgi:hypothetical protein
MGWWHIHTQLWVGCVGEKDSKYEEWQRSFLHALIASHTLWSFPRSPLFLSPFCILRSSEIVLYLPALVYLKQKGSQTREDRTEKDVREHEFRFIQKSVTMFKSFWEQAPVKSWGEKSCKCMRALVDWNVYVSSWWRYLNFPRLKQWLPCKWQWKWSIYVGVLCLAITQPILRRLMRKFVLWMMKIRQSCFDEEETPINEQIGIYSDCYWHFVRKTRLFCAAD